MNIIWLILVVLVVPSWAITNSLNAVEVEHLISSIKCDVCTIRKKFRQHGKVNPNFIKLSELFKIIEMILGASTQASSSNGNDRTTRHTQSTY